MFLARWRERRVKRAGRHLAVAAGLAAGMLLWPLARRGSEDERPKEPADVELPSPPPAPEPTVVEIIRAVQSAQSMYMSVHGYYDRLECLILDTCVPINPYPPRYLSVEMVRATETGAYRFEFREGPRPGGRPAGEAVSATGVERYALVATPRGGQSGEGFCGDDTGSIYRTPDGQRPAVRGGRCLGTGRRLE